MDRKEWLRVSAMLTGGFCALPVMGDPPLAKPRKGNSTFGYFPSDEHNRMFEQNPEIRVRLMSNENPFGPSETARQTLQESIGTSYQYPWAHYGTLSGLIAQHEGVTSDHVMLGAGSSELLSTIALCYGHRGGSVVSAFPTFWTLPEYAERLGVRWIKVPLTSDYAHDFPALERAINDDTGLVYVVNPNNPTGTLSPASGIERFCRRVANNVPVLVDEAYFDYLPEDERPDLVPLIREGLPVIIVRTFSKIYGFAGLRVGYCISTPEVIEELGRFKGVGTIAGPSVKAAATAYEEEEFKTMVLEKNEESKQMLYRTLESKGYEWLPSHTNFVFIPLDKDGETFRLKLLEEGIAIRNWNIDGQHYLRVSLSTPEDMLLFKQVFDRIA